MYGMYHYLCMYVNGKCGLEMTEVRYPREKSIYLSRVLTSLTYSLPAQTTELCIGLSSGVMQPIGLLEACKIHVPAYVLVTYPRTAQLPTSNKRKQKLAQTDEYST